MLAVGRLLGDAGLVHETVSRLGGLAERGFYHEGLWRQGDPAARAIFGLLCLIIGGLIIKAPFIPIFEDTFAFLLTAAGLLYPEVKKAYFDYRHSRRLNRLITHAEKYQKNQRLHYVSEARLREELESVGGPARASMPGLHGNEKPAEAGSQGPPRSKSRG